MAHVWKSAGSGLTPGGYSTSESTLSSRLQGDCFYVLGELITLSVSSSSLIKHILKSLKAGAVALSIPQVCHQHVLREKDWIKPVKFTQRSF